MADINKIAILITKLLALSKDDGATEAEARLAAEKAQALMTEHNLSMAHIEAQGGDSGDGGRRVKDGVGHRQVYKWQRTLMHQLAELNFCYCSEKFESRGWGKARVFDGYSLIGRAANVVSTRVMFEYLVQTIERLARDDVKDPSQFFTRYAHSFKEGCSDRIIDRLQERRAQEIKEQERKAREEKVRSSHPAAATKNALVVVLGDYVQDEQDANEDLRRGREPGTTKALRLAREEQSRIDEMTQILKYEGLRAQGMDHDKAYYLSIGISEDTADRWIKEANKPETEAQRRKREAREAREEQRANNRYWREQQRLDGRGYNRGHDAGGRVGLDRQVGESETRKIT